MKIIDWLVTKRIEVVEPSKVDKAALTMHEKQIALNIEQANYEKYVLQMRDKYLQDKKAFKRRSTGNDGNPSKNPFIKEEDTWGYLTIYDEKGKNIAAYHCKEPTINSPITHTFHVPGNTTVASAKFTSDDGKKFPIKFVEQRFTHMGTFTLTVRKD